MMHWLSLTSFLTPRRLDTAGSTGTRLKELVSIEGVRDNQLIGYGLVVGLNGTGDHQLTIFSAQSLTNMLQQMGVSINPAADSREEHGGGDGDRDSASLRAARHAYRRHRGRHRRRANLQGGLLLMTSLKGVDGQVYAVAQGSVVTGGFGAGRGGNTTTVNHPTVGRVPGGATVERGRRRSRRTITLKLQLRAAGFHDGAAHQLGDQRQVSASRQAARECRKLRAGGRDDSAANTLRARWNSSPTWKLCRCRPTAPREVIINERTGTIVMGKEVRVSPVAIMHGKLTVEIQTQETVSQPGPLSQGTDGSGSRRCDRKRERREIAQPGAANRARRWKNWCARWARSDRRRAT